LPIGGIPADAVLADGSLWVSQSAGSVVRIDPVTRRVTGRIAMPTTPGPMAAGAGSIWVQTMGTKDLDCKGSLVRIDPGSGRIAGRIRLPYPLDGPEGPGVLAATRDGGVWLKHGCTWGRRLERRDRGGAVRLSVPVAGVDGISTAGGKLWVIGHDGTLTRVDAATGRIEKRWAKLAPLADPETRGTTALAADRTGVWVLSTGRDAILRVEGGRVVRRIHVGPSTLPLLVNAPDGLWIASADRLGSDYRLIRFDPSTGSPTAVLKLGIQQPIALVPSDGKLCVVTSNGSIVFVG